jgi:hypothetical protein
MLTEQQSKNECPEPTVEHELDIVLKNWKK